jgi:hypothetical protein
MKHIYKTLFILFVLVFSLFKNDLKAQTTDTLLINWQPHQPIQLQSGVQTFLPFFEDAITRYETAGLPWQIHPLEANKNQLISNPELLIKSYDTLTNHKQLSDLDFIENDFQIISEKHDNQHYIVVLPLKRSGDHIIRLTSYQIQYELVEENQQLLDETPEWKPNSVLASGNWIKIATTREGIYRITAADLQAAGLNPADFNPNYFALFGNGNAMLPEENRLDRPDDLLENAVAAYGTEDGSFDAEDYLLFYSPGPVYWRYNFFTGRYDHQLNYYSDTTYFFFTPDYSQPGKRIMTQEEAQGNTGQIITEFPDYRYHEYDHESLILSGKEWYGEMFTADNPETNFSFEFPNLNRQKPVSLQIQLAGRSITEDSYYSVTTNGMSLVDSTKVFKLSVDNPMFARELTNTAHFNAAADQFNIEVKYHANESSSRLWLNYIRLNAYRELRLNGNPLSFRLPAADTLPGTVELQISGIENQLIWDVSDLTNIRQQNYRSTAGTARFKTNTNTEKRWHAFALDQIMEPEALYQIENQNLHQIQQADMLIITHPLFENHADELASMHQDLDQLNTEVVDVTKIYNEFGGGTPDITAIRDFIRMVYIRSNSNLKYVLLFGDASYDYKNRLAGNTNFIPTYQANSSLIETQSFVSDDYFGLMGAAEGGYMSGILDLGVGRFPVATEEDAAVMVAKNRYYLQKQLELAGSWRNNITFVGDDRDNNLHFDQAETLSRQVDTARANMNVSKIYLDAYPRVTVAGGYRYPEASDALMKQIDNGALIINYTGHGGVNGLSDERVFTLSHINSLTNKDNMPFFITATCEFSRFDNPNFVSAGEQLLLNADGGGIGLMTTTRLAFAHSNFALNKKVYAAMFDRSDNAFKRLGDILRLSKNPTSSSIYNFALLGNPALKLVYPEKTITTTKVNDITVSDREIQLHSMSEVSFEGEIVGADGQTDTGFNGFIYPKLFDKKTVFTTLGNASNSRVSPFSYFDKVLVETKVTVKDGKFKFTIRLPRDIAYQYGQAKLSYYAVDTINLTDATGYFNKLDIGGTDPDIVPDNQGPEISLYMNSPGFKSGDIVAPDSDLWIFLSDPQGIHHLGNSIGRDIVLNTLAPGNGKTILNDAFEPVADHFGQGWIKVPMKDLENGEHILSLKAWDLHNNSSEAEIRFFVDRKAALSVNRVLNYPNPFTDETAFVFDHNKPGAVFDYRIDIYAIDGRYMLSLEGSALGNGQRSEPIVWNGRDQNGRIIPPGVYVYQLLLTDEEGIQSTVFQRFIRANK